MFLIYKWSFGNPVLVGAIEDYSKALIIENHLKGEDGKAKTMIQTLGEVIIPNDSAYISKKFGIGMDKFEANHN